MFQNTDKKIIFFALIMAFIPLTAQAGTIKLNNGDLISGQVTDYSADHYQVTSPSRGTALIPKSDVRLVIQNGQVIFGGTTPAALPEPISINTSTPNTSAFSVPTRRIARAAPSSTPPGRKWFSDWAYEGQVNLGLERSTGNNEESSINADAEVIFEKGKNRFQLNGEIYYEENDDVQVEDERMFKFQYDRYLTDRIFFATDAAYEVDEAANLDLRTTYGIGVGYDFINNDTTTLRGQIGGKDVTEEFSNNTEESFQAAAWEIDFKKKILEKKAEIFHNNTGLMNAEDSEDLDFQSKTGVRFTVYKNLQLSAQINYDWDNQPPPGAEEEDIKYLLSLGYSFGNKD